MKKILITTLFTLASFSAQAKDYEIKMLFNENTGDVYFEPQQLHISSGDTVTFKQADTYNIHNVMFEPQGIPKDANIAMMSPEEMHEGDSWPVTFSTSGTYTYHCHPHYDMGMKGKIIVDRPSTPNDASKDNKHTHGHTHHH